MPKLKALPKAIIGGQSSNTGWLQSSPQNLAHARYRRFLVLDGQHDFREAVADGYVDYEARHRPGGKVAYFNFALAKEMGLIPVDHPHELNEDLTTMITQTFALQIINEWDLANGLKVHPHQKLPGKYMATRYLQLQHPDKRGLTSGDGRSVWNGQVKFQGKIWDVTSCGTGATRLSPATATEGRFFRTGDPQVCYGCGYADLADGMSAALMSEILSKNGLKTERTLALIEFPGEQSINVRAGLNLLRPSHFFHHLKQENYENLRAAIEYYYQRQVQNCAWPQYKSAAQRFRYLTRQVALDFARATANFETEYIFCWLDWDGDNILTDGGIIDYGSIRQFGLYHHEYRYDDGENRWSTNIKEQKIKARYIVQTFAQIENFLITRRKRNIKSFSRSSSLRLFEREFAEQVLKNTLYKVGFNSQQQEVLYRHHRGKVQNFRKIFQYFERAKSSRGKYNTADGITWDAIYCMRDILREMPVFLMNEDRPMHAEEFMEVIASSYANAQDRVLSPFKRNKIMQFQKAYEELLHLVLPRNHLVPQRRRTLLELVMRSSVINQYDRITGNSIIYITDQILRDRRKLSVNHLHSVIENFIDYQKLRPERLKKADVGNQIEHDRSEKVVSSILKLVREYRESL